MYHQIVMKYLMRLSYSNQNRPVLNQSHPKQQKNLHQLSMIINQASIKLNKHLYRFVKSKAILQLIPVKIQIINCYELKTSRIYCLIISSTN